MSPPLPALKAFVARLDRRRRIGAVLVLAAIVVLVGGWSWASATGSASTDNAYIRGDVTSIASRVSGYVRDVEVGDNQPVEAGDILFRIDDADYRARLAQAEANVDAAEARLRNVDAEIALQRSLVRQAGAQRRAAAADLDLAARTDERRRELIERGFISEAGIDASAAARSRAREGLSAASATLDAQRQRIGVLATQRAQAEAALAQAEAARDLAQIDLDNTVVRAPINGVVGNRQVRVGRLVSPGVSMLDIVPVQELWVVANFKETQLERLRPGQRVRIRIDGYQNDIFQGVVDSFAPGSGSAFSLLPADNATGNFIRVVQRVPVKIRFVGEAPDGLAPGLSARVRIDLNAQP
jgi:membrane fusion protein, multidrug efflux system